MNERTQSHTVLLSLAMLLLAAVAATPSSNCPSTGPVPAVRPIPVEYPVVDIPQTYRTHNWAPYGEGSCVHASLVMLLRWQGHTELADWWKRTYHSGETPGGLSRKLEAAGVRFAETRSGDVAFLEWAIRTRRGAAVTVMGGAHMVCLIHLDHQWAGILDNNAPHRIRWQSRKDFLHEWQSSYWRWAVTPVYAPPPRKPWI